MKRAGAGARALAVTVATAAVLGALHAIGVGLYLLLALGLVILVLTWVVPWIGVTWLDDLILFVRGRLEPEPALAARHAGKWRRSAEGELMLRVDAVVQHLATMRDRTDPRVQRLRRYFEREVLFPAAQRRQRAEPPVGPSAKEPAKTPAQPPG